MSSPTAQNLAALKVAHDNSILAVLHFPALIFNVNTLIVVESNGFFSEENHIPFPQLLIKHNFNFLDAADIKQLTQNLKTGRNYSIHKIADSKNEVKTFELRASLLPDSNNAFLYLNLIPGNTKLPDTTDGLGAERAKTSQSDFLKELVHNVYGGIALTDNNNIITFCNRSFAELLGLQEEAITGKSFIDIIGN